MVEAVSTFCGMAGLNQRHHLLKVKSYLFVKSLEGSMEAEAEADAEAVDCRLKEVEVKEKLTAVAPLLHHCLKLVDATLMLHPIRCTYYFEWHWWALFQN